MPPIRSSRVVLLRKLRKESQGETAIDDLAYANRSLSLEYLPPAARPLARDEVHSEFVCARAARRHHYYRPHRGLVRSGPRALLAVVE